MTVRTKKVVVVTVLFLIVAVGISVISRVRHESDVRHHKSRVLSVVRIGDKISDAQQAVRDRGYQLTYGEPLDQTGTGEEWIQIVNLFYSSPTALDTLWYVTTGGSPPFARSASRLVIVSDADGIVTKIR